jgi:hypothetical protein
MIKYREIFYICWKVCKSCLWAYCLKIYLNANLWCHCTENGSVSSFYRLIAFLVRSDTAFFYIIKCTLSDPLSRRQEKWYWFLLKRNHVSVSNGGCRRLAAVDVLQTNCTLHSATKQPLGCNTSRTSCRHSEDRIRITAAWAAGSRPVSLVNLKKQTFIFVTVVFDKLKLRVFLIFKMSTICGTY